MSFSMIDSLLTNEVQEYEDNNNYIREKLKLIISKNTKYNLRELSRYLNKNDAYLQQYLYRSTPKILPEEYRYKLSNILEIDVEELSPKWTNYYSNKAEHVSIKNVEKDNLSKTQSISFSKHLLNDLDLSRLESFFFFQITTDQCTVTNIIDININSYKEPGLYLLNDKNIYFLVYLDMSSQDNNKISVKPYLKTFSPFHIVKDALNISARVVWQSSKIFLK
jgi:hypothetical protein